MANEKRLIYADEAIELINGLESLPWEEETEYLVNSLTTVDAVEVVRCKDCMWFDTEDELADVFRKEKHCFCTEMNTYVSENGFCSYGERKDNG